MKLTQEQFEVAYAYLYEGKSHARIDENILNVKVKGNHNGWTSGNILRSLGLDGSKKSILKTRDIDIEIENASDKYLETLQEMKMFMQAKNHKLNDDMKRYTNLLQAKNQIILQGAPGTGKTYTAKDIAEQMIFETVSKDKTEQSKRLKGSNQFELVQFHPSYTYEDLIRGIVVDTSDNSSPQYITKNKILGKFANLALRNYEDSKKEPEQLIEELEYEEKLNLFIEKVRKVIDEGEVFPLGTDTKASIVAIEDTAFRYSFPTPREHILYTLLFSDLREMGLKTITRSIDVRDMDLKMKGKYPYYYRVHQAVLDMDIQKEKIDQSVEEKKYVLIIDEINRANLSAVLGELIYALEYRGDALAGLYELGNGDNTLILPPNLYIIGTMNTADRSVGHIDYAIRRRFAFVDVEAKDLSDAQLPDGYKFESVLFENVSKLFLEPEESSTNSYKYLSQEFEPKDVQLGHSYFITSDKPPIEMRLEYEIKPLLREYLRDGILKESARAVINGLQL